MEATAATRFDVRRSEPNRWALPAALLAMWLATLGTTYTTCPAQEGPVQEVSQDPLRVRGNSIYRWDIGGADASLLEGECVIEHSGRTMTARRVLVVVDGSSGRIRSRVVVDGSSGEGGRVSGPSSLLFFTVSEPWIDAPLFRPQPSQPPDLLQHLPTDDNTVGTGGSPVRQVQFAQDTNLAPPLVNPPLDRPPPITLSDGATTGGFQFFTGGGTRSVEILGRGASSPPVIETINRPEVGETVILARGGVTVLIRDVTAQLPSGELMQLGTISLSADRVVGWLPLLSGLIDGSSDFSQADGELYLEGDIVFRQGERIIYAESMYYNINSEQGMVLNAEAITTIPEYQGVVRLKADVLQQVAKGNFIAFDAAVTSSRMGVPRYWLQSQRLQLTDRQQVQPDPVTGVPVSRNQAFVDSRNNFIFFGGVPILYWPTFATSLDRPSFYLSGARVNNDDIFGTQIYLDFDMFQLLGIENVPSGVDWDLSTDYLSDRGPAVGTSLDYNVPGLLGIPGPVIGSLDTWIIDDRGTDTLGLDRQNLTPEESVRGRSLLRHRHYLPNDYELIAEIGWISDRNFLEQYFENEWDQDVDHRTALRLRKYYFGHMFDLTADVQVNDFFTKTEQLPLLEHYMIGGAILGDRFTWSAHNKVGYEKLNVGDPPKNAAEAAAQAPVPGEIDREGLVAATRQELALPIQLGALKVVPNVSGEAAHYGQAADGDSLSRLLGQAGVRASLSAWSVDPSIQSSLLNIRGLAHKVEWTAEYFYADSDTNLDELPLYDPLDDDSQEQFRRRLINQLYGGTLPERFDPRTYAFRHGFQRWIASPSDVIADDLQQFRLGLHQRWQTKRGLPGRERIVDLFQADVDLIVFPDADRDNFGESLGPATYDVRYHIGDRVTLLSDGYVDFFDDGLRSISAGMRSSRPGIGDVYVGLLSLEGPISSTVLRSTVDYRLNEKWIASGATVYDFGSTGSVGQTVALTRIGESLLWRVGLNIDRGRDNVGFSFGIEPRFWPRARLGRIGGQLIPPPGVEGLE